MRPGGNSGTGVAAWRHLSVRLTWHPFIRNDRNVRNTPYQYLPSRVEQASIETYAVKTRSLPPGGKSMLDTLGATVAFVIRYDLGTVVYIGYNYNTPFHADQWTRVLHCAIDM